MELPFDVLLLKHFILVIFSIADCVTYPFSKPPVIPSKSPPRPLP